MKKWIIGGTLAGLPSGHSACPLHRFTGTHREGVGVIPALEAAPAQ